MAYYVVVAGNIGVGKSSLTELLAARLGWQPYYEHVAENAYLADFYRDMYSWSLHSQLFFLTRRVDTHQQIAASGASIVQDRSVYEDAEVFARNLNRQGYLSERDWNLYYELYHLLTKQLRPPSLIIYLRASVSTLLRRIAMRGRDFEATISADYLAQLNALYDEWLSTFDLCPVLTIETDSLDFVHEAPHLDQIASRIADRLQGREELKFT